MDTEAHGVVCSGRAVQARDWRHRGGVQHQQVVAPALAIERALEWTAMELSALGKLRLKELRTISTDERVQLRSATGAASSNLPIRVRPRKSRLV